MARVCSVCNKKIGLMTGVVDLADGKCCVPCWEHAGFKKAVDSLLVGETLMSSDVKKSLKLVKQMHQRLQTSNQQEPLNIWKAEWSLTI